MKSVPLAGLLGLAALGVQAQSLPASPSSKNIVVITASRGLRVAPTLRDAIVISRHELEQDAALSLAEVLQRRAGIEVRATGGPGQPQGLFIRGAGTAQALVLVDGLRVGSATIGTTSIENIPVELIERIEVVKGPLSSLYGSDAIGGVIQVFTRGKDVPHLFVDAGAGSDQDLRASAGIATAEESTSLALSAGVRTVDAPSATNERNFCFDDDRDPYENAFASVRASHRLWQGELIEIQAFGSRGRTRFDGCTDFLGERHDDLSVQTIGGAKLTSSTQFTSWWSSRLSLGQGRDRLVVTGAFPSRFETRQDQASWINEFATAAGSVVAGVETVRQKVLADHLVDDTGTEVPFFARDRRDTDSFFVGLNESWLGHRLEASWRRDDEDQFGRRDTGSLSYGLAWPSVAQFAATVGRGFRAPSFYDLYGPASDFYRPNPGLRPERSRSAEVSVSSDPGAAVSWRLTAYDNRIEDLVTFSFAEATVLNVHRARIRGVEAAVNATWLGVRWRMSATVQRPRDDDTGRRLPGRAERFGSLEATRRFGAWTAGIAVVGSADRYDAPGEPASARLPGYAVVDARLRYAFAKFWSVELTARNLADKRYESALGYDAPRRSAFLAVRFEAF